MASNPPGKCCTTGTLHDGEPIGRCFQIENIDVYESKASGDEIRQNTAILLLPDVIGIWQNSKLIADEFASNGYHTLMIDLFNRDPVKLNRPDGFDFFSWLTHGTDGKNPHTAEYVDPIVTKAIKYLHNKNYTKIGAAGYCFGAKYVARFMAPGKGISVGYVAHPSFVEKEELAGIKGPFSIAAAETDEIFPVEKRHESETILAGTGQPYQINLYSGVVHGFAVRGELNNRIERFSKEQAFLQAVVWFDEYLA